MQLLLPASLYCISNSALSNSNCINLVGGGYAFFFLPKKKPPQNFFFFCFRVTPINSGLLSSIITAQGGYGRSQDVQMRYRASMVLLVKDPAVRCTIFSTSAASDYPLISVHFYFPFVICF